MRQHAARALAAALALGLALPAVADVTATQKTKIQFTGFAGAVINMFGGKAAKEGITSTDMVQGDRRVHRTEDSGEMVDLSDEKVWTINYAKKTYSVKTFAEIREEMRKAMEDAKKDQAERDQKGEKPPEYEVDVDIKETGRRERIGDFDTREVVVTITVRGKGKKLEESGGALLISSLWMGPKLAPMDELMNFELAYAKKLGLLDMMGGKQMAAMLAAWPALGEAMKKFQDHKGTLNGTPIRTVVTMDTVAAPGQAQAQGGEASDEEGTPTSIGGLFGKLGKKVAAKQEEKKGGNPNRKTVFTSTNDLLKVTQQVAQAEMEIPAGFKQKN